MNTLSIIVIALFAIGIFIGIKRCLHKDCVDIIEKHSYRVGILTYTTAQAAFARAKGYQNRLKIEPDIKMINCISGKETILTMAQLEMYALKEMKDEQDNPWQYYES